MKRLATLVLALCLTLGAASQASAIEVQPSGVMDFVFAYANGAGGGGGRDGAFGQDMEYDRFIARQRARIQVDFIANENLRGVLMFQIGNGADGYEWGRGGFALDGTSDSPLVRRAYIDFNFPDSPVNMKMGLMDLVLPYATFGQPVFGNHVAAVTATANVTDNAALTAFWARPLRNSTAYEKKDNDMDVFGLWANLDFDSFTVAPWAAYASIGANSGWFDREYDFGGLEVNGANWGGYGLESDTANWWGAGLALKVMPSDALTVKFDAMYASLKAEGDMNNFNGAITGDPVLNPDGKNAPEARGYYFALAVDYALDWGTPGLFAIYSSGDDAEDGDDYYKSGRIPGLGYDDNLWPTRMAFAGSMTCAHDSYLNVSGIGLWMLGAQIANMSFIENVNHTARLAYIRGTNHIDSPIVREGDGAFFGNVVPLAYEDQAWEVGFDSYWQMYENLTIGLELGYLHFDVTDKNDRDEDFDKDGVYSANLIFRFGF